MKMKKVVLFLTALLITSSLYSQPKFEFVGAKGKDWGKVLQNAGPLHTTIKIKNTGNKQLEIFGVKPGCGCTNAPIDKSLLAPGEIATVAVTLKIDKDSGPITKGIEFTSNDPVNDRIGYDLKANIKVPIELFPKFINMGNITPNKEISGKIVLSNHTPKDIKITQVKTSNPKLKTSFKAGQVLKSGSHNPVEGIIKSGDEGMIDAKIILMTNSKAYPMIEIPVRGMVGK